VIEELFAGDGGSNDKAVLGTMLHELFQAALNRDGDLAAADLTAAVDQIVASSTLMLFEVRRRNFMYFFVHVSSGLSNRYRTMS
jgi:hypothetical protein